MIEAQINELKKYASDHNLEVVNIYSDNGYSGSDLNRPGLQDLINEVESNSIDRVLVYSLDKLSRSMTDTLYLIENVFHKHNTRLISVLNDFDTSTGSGLLLMTRLTIGAYNEKFFTKKA